MKYIKCYLIFSLAIFIISNLSAQEQYKSHRQINEKPQGKTAKLTKLPKWLNAECQDTIAKLDSINVTMQNEIHGLKQQNTNDSLKQKKIMDKLKQQNDNLNLSLQEEKDSSKIDKFLNINDTTIFGTRFMKITDTMQIHPQRRDWYLLIENIHDMKDLLTANSPRGDVFETLEKLKNNQVLEKTHQKIMKINSFDCFDFLTDRQKLFYRELVTRYNNLNRYANPDGNQ